MKVKIENEAGARLFGCAIGDFRDLQRPDAEALIEAGSVSAVEDDEVAPASLNDMTIDQLKAYAVEHSIDLGAATKKADIRAAIAAAAE